ncbi:MAG: EAL domain-containing protein [Lachnospiraceae bacterium]|nr:EAL domain-containing protein [Lachnospiraceae bacterium]
MDRFYQYDIAAVIVLAILLLSVYFRKLYIGRVNMTFVYIMIIMLVCTLCDIGGDAPFVFFNNTDRDLRFRYICLYGYFIAHSFILPAYIIFVGLLTGTWYKFIRSRLRQICFIVPFVINIAVILINPLNGKMFYISEDLKYHRGPLLSVCYIVAAYYMVICAVYVFKSVNLLGKGKTVGLLMLFPCNILALIIQYFRPKNMVEMFALSISALIVTVAVLRAEEMVDPSIDARTFSSFFEDVKRYYMSDKNVTVILMKVKNDEAIVSLFGAKIHRDVVKDIIHRIRQNYKDLSSEKGVIVNVYYLFYGEFCVIIDGSRDREMVKLKTEILLEEFKEEFTINNNPIDLDMRMCMLDIPQDIPDMDDFVSFVDSFEKTVDSRELVHFSEVAPEHKLQLKLDIDKIIKKALEEKNFEMYYQPIYSLKEKKFTSAEALIRLKDSELGYVSPGLFIPAAEKNGAINKIGNFVIDDVFKFISENSLEEYGLDYIEINLSSIQCLQDNLPEQIEKKIDQYKLDKEKLNFEVTETGKDYVKDSVFDTISRLHNMDYELSLDDYGTGYSNLQKVISFPFKIIKIDKSLVDDMNDSRMREVIMQTVKMIKGIGAEIVVEGVETKEASDWFEEIGCDFIQGYYYAKPMPKNDFLSFIRKNNS